MEEKKLVPKRRFENFTKSWNPHKLDDYTKLITKGTTPKDKSGKGTINFVKVENIKNGKIYPTSKISEEEHENYLKRSKLEENDILFSIAGTLGRTSVVEKSILPANTNQALAIIRDYNFDTKFLLTSLSGKVVSDYVKRSPTIGAQPNLSLEQVGDFNISAPEIEEQQKIGEFFKVLDKRIANQERKIAKVKALKTAYLTEMFPQEGEVIPKKRFKGFSGKWKLKTLSSVCSDISDGDWIENEHINNSGKYRIIQTGNIGVGKFLNRERFAKYINQMSFDTLKANEVFPGDILISRLAEPAGRSIIVPDVNKKMVTAVDVTIIRGNDCFDEYFLVTQLNSENILSKINENVSGTSHKRISRKNLEKTLLNIPEDIAEQQKIGEFFKNLDDKIAIEEKKLEKLKKMKEAYLEEMFV